MWSCSPNIFVNYFDCDRYSDSHVTGAVYPCLLSLNPWRWSIPIFRLCLVLLQQMHAASVAGLWNLMRMNEVHLNTKCLLLPNWILPSKWNNFRMGIILILTDRSLSTPFRNIAENSPQDSRCLSVCCFVCVSVTIKHFEFWRWKSCYSYSVYQQHGWDCSAKSGC